MVNIAGKIIVFLLCLFALSARAQENFWGTPGGVPANINRFPNRVFIGSAVSDDGIFWSNGCSTCGGGATNHLDWFEKLYDKSYNGGVGIYSDDPFAQTVILADPDSAAAKMAVPSVALVVAAETLNSVDGSTVRAMDLTIINNAISGQNPGGWGLYIEGHAVGTSKTNTYGIELEMRNSAGVSHWDPFSTPASSGSTPGLELGCGAGLPATGMFDCTVGEYFAANPKPWSTGILFFPDSVDASGPGGTIPAIAMPPNFQVQWYTAANTLGGTLTGDAVGGLWIGGNALHVPGAMAFTNPPYGVPAYYACFTVDMYLVVSVNPCP